MRELAKEDCIGNPFLMVFQDKTAQTVVIHRARDWHGMNKWGSVSMWKFRGRTFQ